MSCELPTAIAQVDALRAQANTARGYGYRIQWQQRRDRRLGQNTFPDVLYLDSLDDLVRLIGKQQEFAALQTAVQRLRTQQPSLETWLHESGRWRELLTVAPDLHELLTVVDYFQQHPRPDYFIRELPLPISTKLVEQHRRVLGQWLDLLLPPAAIDTRYSHRQFEPRYGLRYVRPHFLLRVLDQSLKEELSLPFDELSLPAESLARLAVRDARVFIVENKVDLMTFPEVPRSLALGGLGSGVTQLGDVGWLQETPIDYWGDLDVEGFEILGRLRQRFPHVRSFLMDLQPSSCCSLSLRDESPSFRRGTPHRFYESQLPDECTRTDLPPAVGSLALGSLNANDALPFMPPTSFYGCRLRWRRGLSVRSGSR